MSEITQGPGQIVAQTNDRTLRRVFARIGVWLGACLGVLFILALAAGIGTQAKTPLGPEVTTAGTTTGKQSLASRSGWLAPQFAIADFDGDLRPDLASIQTGRSDSGNTTYSVHLQLSAIGRQSISVIAPVGGLTIEARDVNGDHAIDLVLATAWTRQPVAIFLNDGHGGFSRVATGVYPSAFTQSQTEWGYRPALTADAACTPPQWHAGIYLRQDSGRVPVRTRSRFQGLRAGVLHKSALTSHAGRAPPIEV